MFQSPKRIGGLPRVRAGLHIVRGYSGDVRAVGLGAMVANANPAATPPQATQIALADLLGRNHSNRRCSHDHRDHRVSEVGTQLRRAASLSWMVACTCESI